MKKEAIFNTSAPALAALSTTLRSSDAGMGPVDSAPAFGNFLSLGISCITALVWEFLLEMENFWLGIGNNDLDTLESLSLRGIDAGERRARVIRRDYGGLIEEGGEIKRGSFFFSPLWTFFPFLNFSRHPPRISNVKNNSQIIVSLKGILN